MKRNNTLRMSLLFLLCALYSSAQTVEEITQKINQTLYNYAPYSDAGSSFMFRKEALQPESDGNFNFFFYHKVEGEIAQFQNSDLDFSKVIGISTENESLFLHFPKKMVSTRVTLRDFDKEVQKTRYVTLFAQEKDKAQMTKALYDLVINSKIKKGVMTQNEAKKEWKAYTTMHPDIFVHEHRNSILSYPYYAAKDQARRQENFDYLEEELPLAFEKEKDRFPDLRIQTQECEAILLYSEGNHLHRIVLPYGKIQISDEGILSYAEPKVQYFQKLKSSSEAFEKVSTKKDLSPLKISKGQYIAHYFSTLGSFCD
ncbi:hypothetical protein ACX3PU_03695 [Chryseobacterium sp. A301]